MKKKLLIILCMMLMSLSLLTACAGDSHSSSDRDWDSDMDLDEDEEEEGSLEELVESAFYVKEVSSNGSSLPSETPEESASDSTETKGSITITWNSDAAGNISGQPYDLTVLLSGSSNDGTAITCDADGESYLDAQGNLVASVKEIDEQITIEFYHTDMKYNITIENATPDNGWAGETTITCNLPRVTDFDQNNHYYRGATGVWYYSFGVENGVVVPAN